MTSVDRMKENSLSGLKLPLKLISSHTLHREHDRRYKLWMERDARFLSQFTEPQLQQVQDFVTLYNVDKSS